MGTGIWTQGRLAPSQKWESLELLPQGQPLLRLLYPGLPLAALRVSQLLSFFLVAWPCQLLMAFCTLAGSWWRPWGQGPGGCFWLWDQVLLSAAHGLARAWDGSSGEDLSGPAAPDPEFPLGCWTRPLSGSGRLGRAVSFCMDPGEAGSPRQCGPLFQRCPSFSLLLSE